MILRSTQTSPFGRKVKIAAAVLGLAERIDIVDASPWNEADDLRRQNPLGKMPVLIADDGAAIYDSAVILDYLDSLGPRPRLIPPHGAERRRALVFQALGDGIMEAGLLVTYEKTRRPQAFAYADWIAHQTGKIERALSSLVADAPDPRVADAGSIAVACALGYLDWRKQALWRETHPALIAWLEEFAAHVPAFAATFAQPDR